jgi:hypothetical protein
MEFAVPTAVRFRADIVGSSLIAIRRCLLVLQFAVSRYLVIVHISKFFDELICVLIVCDICHNPGSIQLILKEN